MGDTDPLRWSGQPFGDLLRQLRRASGFTQAELAERANLSTRGLSDLERGINRAPRRETLLALADAFGLTEEERQRFFAAARRRPALAPDLSSPPSSTSLPSSGSPPSSVSTSSLPEPESQLAPPPVQTFLIADMRGYTSFTATHGDEAAARLASRFAAVARLVVGERGGKVLELRGDEIMAVFPSARQALRAAVELQARWQAEGQTHPSAHVPIGAGLDAGEAVPAEGGFRGTALNLTGRLCSLAGPDEVIASETLIHLAGMVEGLFYRERGTVQLKGFAEPVRIWRVSAATDTLEEASLRPSAPLPAEVGSDRTRVPAAYPIGNFLGALPDGPIVAREAELSRIEAALGAVMEGAGRLLLLGGEPGVGKTRLAQEAMLAARNRGFLIATGRCYEPQQTVPYYPFLEAMSRAYQAAAVSLRTELPRRWPDVARLLPDRPSSLQIPAAASGSREEQQRLFWQVTGFLQALAETQPVALLLDDVQWADSASLDLLQHLARHTRASRLLLLGVYRDIEITASHPFEAVLRDLGREHLLERLSIRRLSPEGTATLLATSFGLEQVSDEFAGPLYARTEGNPFFTVEILRDLVERGDLYQESDRWQKRERVEIVLPDTVRSVITQRLARLSTTTHTTLQEASVLGQTFRVTDLQAMSAQDSGAVEVALEEAEVAALVREAVPDSCAFQHVLIQQTLYSELSARRRQRLHRAAGEALEHLGERERERRIAELAYHFARTDNLGRALEYSVQAAERAREAGARREEAALLGQALEAAQRLEDPQVVAELHAKRGQAFNAAALWSDASTELEAALAGLAPEQAEQRALILVERSTATYFLASPNMRAQATEALEVAERIGRDDLAARAMSNLAICDTIDGLVRESQPRFEQAFARAGTDHMPSLHTGLDQYGLNWYYLSQYDRAITHTRQALELARSMQDSAIITRTLGNLGMALTGSGRYTEALAVFAEARTRGSDDKVWQWVARSISMNAGLHLALGDYGRAQDLTEQAREVNRMVGFDSVTASTGVDLLLTFTRRHEPGRADEILARVKEIVMKLVGSHLWLLALRLAQAQAEVKLAQGAYTEALRCTEESLTRAKQTGRLKYEVLGLQTQAQALAGLGRTNDAIPTLRAAVERARMIGDPALFLHVAAALLAIEGDDLLLAEAVATVKRITEALPDELQRAFSDTESVQLVSRLSR
jgi:class 3 adenylate cyclase/tetratricopeptide (TPR) repeat protein/DNA-binding XRE family transcriptional regulator